MIILISKIQQCPVNNEKPRRELLITILLLLCFFSVVEQLKRNIITKEILLR